MDITFTPAKREAALQGRGLDFLDAGFVFAGRRLQFRDDRQDYGEDRFVTVGLLFSRMVLVVWTPRDGKRHVISMRKANDREQARYRHLLG